MENSKHFEVCGYAFEILKLKNRCKHFPKDAETYSYIF